MRLHLAGCLPQVFESCGFGIQIAPPTFATEADAEAPASEGWTWVGVLCSSAFTVPVDTCWLEG